MNKKFPSFLITIGVLVLSTTALAAYHRSFGPAQDKSFGPPREEPPAAPVQKEKVRSLFPEEISQKVKEQFIPKKETKEVKEELKTDQTAEPAKTAPGQAVKPLKHFRFAIARFENIVKRLESRVARMEDHGIDVSKTKSQLEEAKKILTPAQTNLETAKEKYAALLAGGQPKGQVKEARTVVTELKAKVKELHKKLREIIKALKKTKSTG
jgi:exonuclease VII small subunit